MRLALPFAAMATLGILTLTRPASACEPLPCQSGYLLPVKGTVPENAPGIVWKSSDGGPQRPLATPVDIQVWLLAGGAKTQVEVSVTAGQPAQRGLLVKPKKDWRAGQQFEVSAGSDCAYGSHGAGRFETTFTIGPEAPLPKQLGTLKVKPRVVGPLVMGTASGSCSVRERAAYVDVELEPSHEAQAWLAVLELETLVDGKRWFVSDSINVAAPAWSSWIGRGKDRLYLKCDPQGHAFEGLSAGEHEVVMAATVAGSSTRITSAPAKVRLSCLPDRADKLPAPSADSGVGATPGATTGPGSGKGPPSVGPSGRSCGCGAVGQRHSTCSCRAAGERHGNPLAALAGLLLVAAARMRRGAWLS